MSFVEGLPLNMATNHMLEAIWIIWRIIRDQWMSLEVLGGQL